MLSAVLLTIALWPAAPAAADPAEIERFLLEAEVVERKRLDAGVTRSFRLTLTDGRRTSWAVWKTIDEYQPFKRFYDHGLPEVGFRDSYKSELAAYELDKLLALGLVPPTVERRIERRTGALQIWVDGCINEAERRKRGLAPPDGRAWGAQTYNYRLFHQLIRDTDYLNLSNILVEEDTFRVWIIDSSRAFHTRGNLLDKVYLRRFSRPLLERLRALTLGELESGLGRWLTRVQIKALLERRDLIVAHADALVAERGEAAVLYDLGQSSVGAGGSTE